MSKLQDIKNALNFNSSTTRDDKLSAVSVVIAKMVAGKLQDQKRSPRELQVGDISEFISQLPDTFVQSDYELITSKVMENITDYEVSTKYPHSCGGWDRPDTLYSPDDYNDNCSALFANL